MAPSSVYQYKLQKALEMYLPAHAVTYCFSLWQQHPFIFKIKNPRLSKAGDYCYLPSQKKHVITINRNLNPFNFLITYIHEVAHLVAFETYGRNIMPHGKEWKTTFTQLMLPMLNADVFPPEILKVAIKHFKSPKASTAGDPELVRVLSRYNKNQSEVHLLLDDVPVGGVFTFRAKTYQKLEKRRTRILCAEKNTGKKYLISKAAMVENSSTC